jgi:hypothetical protein
MIEQQVENKIAARQFQISRFSRTVRYILIADVTLILILIVGFVFPSKLTLPEPGQAQPEAYYDYSAKVSPIVVTRAAPPARKRAMPVISARTAEADLAVLKGTT